MVLFYRLLFYLVGLVVLTLGVSLTIKAEIGAGSWDALNVALSETVGFTIGSWVIIIGISLIVLNSLMLHTKPDLWAFVPNVMIGMMIDFWMVVLRNMDPVFVLEKLLMFVVGVMIIAIGVSLYLQPKFSVNPIDNLMVAIHTRLKVSLMTAKTIGEVLALVFAILLHGPVGIGTVFITFFIGPSIQLFYPYFERLLTRLVISHT